MNQNQISGQNLLQHNDVLPSWKIIDRLHILKFKKNYAIFAPFLSAY